MFKGANSPKKDKKEKKLFRFKGAYIDSGAVDFSDKLRSSRRKGLAKIQFVKKRKFRRKQFGGKVR